VEHLRRNEVHSELSGSAVQRFLNMRPAYSINMLRETLTPEPGSASSGGPLSCPPCRKAFRSFFFFSRSQFLDKN